MKEQEIINGLKDRDETTCRWILGKYLGAFISHVIIKFKGEKTEAVELMHEALLDCMDNIAANKYYPDGDNSFEKYFFTIARNKALTFYRNKHRRNKRNPISTLNPEVEFSGGEQPDEKQLIEKDEKELQKMKHLQNCLHEMTEEDRTLMTKRYVDGLKWEEIAEAMGFSTGNARVKSNRLKAKLKKCMASKLAKN